MVPVSVHFKNLQKNIIEIGQVTLSVSMGINYRLKQQIKKKYFLSNTYRHITTNPVNDHQNAYTKMQVSANRTKEQCTLDHK